MDTFQDAGYYGSEAVPLQEAQGDDARTEQVTAELLAGSVSKMSLAREVLRLKQLRDELSTSSDELGALRERAAILQAEIQAEEESASRETIELAEQVALAREQLLAVVGGESAGGTLVTALASAQGDLGQSDHKGNVEESYQEEAGSEQDDFVGNKAENRFDARFIKKLLDAKQRLAETSVEYATPLEKSSGHIKNFLRTSNCRIQIICDRIDTIVPQRPIHEHRADVSEVPQSLALLRENAHLRMSVNEYTEGLLAETFNLLQSAPTTTPATMG